MAAQCMTQSFLGSSIRSAVPVKGKVGAISADCPTVIGVANPQAVSCWHSSLSYKRMRDSTSGLVTLSSTGFHNGTCCVQGTRQVTKASVDWYGPSK